METTPGIFTQLIQQKEILKDFSKILNAGYNLDKLLDYFLGVIQELLKVGRIALLYEEGASFNVKACRGIPPDIAQRTVFPLKEGLINHIEEKGTAVRIDSIELLDSGMVNQFRALGVTTAVPIWEHGRLKAVLVFNNKIVGAQVTDEELELVFALGSQLAAAIENAGLVELISRQRNYLENILVNVGSAVISVDLNGTITTYNPKAEEILGISSAEVIGKSINSLPHDISVLIKDTINTGRQIFRKEVKITALNKSVGVSINFIRDSGGDASGAVMIFTDLAPIKALEEQNRRSDRLDFVNTVAMRSSHELKNCLVSIKTFAQLLPERYQDKQFREDFYLVVNKEVDRLNQVVENLLFFAQTLKLDYSPSDIEEVIEETLGSLEGEGLLEAVEIKKQFSHANTLTNIDRDAFKRVLRHLLVNSVQAMPKGGAVHILTGNDQASFEIKIVDEGIGIPAELVDKIWEPFFTTKTRGIGLGLTITRKIIEAHGGTVDVKSGPGGKGALFIVRLPQLPETNKKRIGEKMYFPSGRAIVV